MSEQPPPQEPDPPEHRPPATPPLHSANAAAPQGGGSVVLGTVLGVLYFAALVAFGGLLARLPSFPLAYIVLVVAYLVAAGVLGAATRTARFGAGLWIGFGLSLLLAAGVCVALLAGVGRTTSTVPPR